MWWEIQAMGARTKGWVCVIRYMGSRKAWRAVLRAQGWSMKRIAGREWQVVPVPPEQKG